MQKRMSAFARGVAAEKKNPLMSPLSDHDPKISIGESEFRLIFTAKHWQTRRPALRFSAIKQALMDGINTPWPTSTRAEHHQAVKDVQKILGLLLMGLPIGANL
jgi:hypothetical protein